MQETNQNSRNFPIIDLGDFILREQTIADAPAFFEYYADPEVNKYIISSIPKTVEEAKTEISYWINVFDYNDGVYFAIARKSDNKMIGSVGVSGINRMHNRIEASYDLAKEYWGGGLMSKSLKAVTDYVFKHKKYNRIEAVAMTDNAGSYKVLENCGFTFEGILRQHRFHKGQYVDVRSYSLLYSDSI
ncbi:MAG: ribosomal-protein-alanine N-acetyltransferase [Rickettsiales bacterium]|jgi:ribosomal-protein-alanine N-acetyltransferase